MTTYIPPLILVFVIAFNLGTLTAMLMWRARRVADWKLSSHAAWILAVKAILIGTGASVVIGIVILAVFGSHTHTNWASFLAVAVIALALRQLLPGLAARTGASVAAYDARPVALSAVAFWIGAGLILGFLMLVMLPRTYSVNAPSFAGRHCEWGSCRVGPPMREPASREA